MLGKKNVLKLNAKGDRIACLAQHISLVTPIPIIMIEAKSTDIYDEVED